MTLQIAPSVEKKGHIKNLEKMANDIGHYKFFGKRSELDVVKARLDGYLQCLEEEGRINHEDAVDLRKCYQLW